MPELPDITVYLEALERRVVGRALEKFRIEAFFVLRTTVPPIDARAGRKIVALRRVGKRTAFGFEAGRWLVLHLMIAGRLQWMEVGTPLRGVLSSDANRSSNPRRLGEPSLRAHDPGGIDVFGATTEEFAAVLTRENHTLKCALTDPRSFSGIGNACSDEILHAARLSPVTLTQKLSPGEIARLHTAVREVLGAWTERLRHETGGGFPAKVTAFRPEMAVHGRFGQPCQVCGTTVQRIRYAENEVNYCPRCQTGGRLLADRSLSRLLKSDWPRTIDEAESLPRSR